jgi:hypothetical protein
LAGELTPGYGWRSHTARNLFFLFSFPFLSPVFLGNLGCLRFFSFFLLGWTAFCLDTLCLSPLSQRPRPVRRDYHSSIKCTLGNNHDVHARVSTLIFMLKFVGLWEVMYATFACRTHSFASETLNKIQRIKYGVVVSHRLRSFVGQ